MNRPPTLQLVYMHATDASKLNISHAIFIIYRPGARGIRRYISRSDDIFRGAFPRGKYHY